MKIPIIKTAFAIISIACLLATFILLPACQTESLPESSATSVIKPIDDISISELKEKLENGNQLLLVDIRSEDLYFDSHIEGAVSIPLDEIPERYHEIPQDIEVIVYSDCA